MISMEVRCIVWILLVLAAASEDDANLLLQLKKSLGNPQVLESWNNNNVSKICDWDGVTCSQQGKLLGITLDSKGLNGTLSSLSGLSGKLQNLSMAGNNLTGQLGDLGPSCSLKTLNLSGNKIQGTFPADFLKLCGNLATLDVSSNFLSGDLAALNNLSSPNLVELHLSRNNLTGINLGGKWTKLNKLDVSSNLVTRGPILDAGSAFPVLTMVNFSNNNVTGGFVEALGVLEDNYVAVLPSLEVLDASFNNMTGRVPSIAAKITTMTSLDLCSNQFSTTGLSICNQSSSKLESLLLVNNRLSDEALQATMNCSELTKLDISFNSLKGKIPEDMCKKIPKLRHFTAWANQLSGSIPKTLGSDCTNLTTLVLNHNVLEDTIPEELSSCSKLEWLSLSSNRLTGSIPSSFGLLKKLAFLQLGNNRLSGVIPPSISENCSSLIWLELGSNNLTGRLPTFVASTKNRVVSPKETLSEGVIGFAMNTAVDCKGLGGLLELQGVTDNKLNGLLNASGCGAGRLYRASAYNYSAVLNNKIQLQSPLSIDVSYNQLTGGIPQELGQLGDLIMLDLGHNRLDGGIPTSFGKLRRLGILDLSSNMLNGSIPNELCNLTFLSSFDVSNNSLSGPIPQKGQLTTFSEKSYANNVGLCGFPLINRTECSPNGPNGPNPNTYYYVKQSRWRKDRTIASLVAAFLGSVFMAILFCWVWCKIQNSRTIRQQQLEKRDGRDLNHHSLSINLTQFEKPLQKVTFADLWRATDGFSSEFLIGSGGSGEVYKAILGDGNVVAVKKLLKTSSQSDREFMAEMETLGKIQHRSLVTLVGYCQCRDEKLLVYEFMQGGSLEQILHDPKLGVVSVPWSCRAQIAMGAARGLAFLHHSCIPHIIHRDMKSSNVLLDMTLQEARVSDFGMARLMCASDTHLSVTTLSGTPGYVPPEYYQSFRCTRNGDVYSFGVILLELLTRKRPTDKDEFGDSNLVGWVKSCVSKGKSFEVLDPDVSSGSRVEMLQYLDIACACLDDRPHKRPSMLQVVARFKEISLLDHSIVD